MFARLTRGVGSAHRERASSFLGDGPRGTEPTHQPGEEVVEQLLFLGVRGERARVASELFGRALPVSDAHEVRAHAQVPQRGAEEIARRTEALQADPAGHVDDDLFRTGARVVRAATRLGEVAHHVDSGATQRREGLSQFLGVGQAAHIVARGENHRAHGRVAAQPLQPPEKRGQRARRGRAVHRHRDHQASAGQPGPAVPIEAQGGVVPGDLVTPGKTSGAGHDPSPADLEPDDRAPRERVVHVGFATHRAEGRDLHPSARADTRAALLREHPVHTHAEHVRAGWTPAHAHEERAVEPDRRLARTDKRAYDQRESPRRCGVPGDPEVQGGLAVEPGHGAVGHGVERTEQTPAQPECKASIQGPREPELTGREGSHVTAGRQDRGG